MSLHHHRCRRRRADGGRSGSDAAGGSRSSWDQKRADVTECVFKQFSLLETAFDAGTHTHTHIYTHKLICIRPGPDFHQYNINVMLTFHKTETLTSGAGSQDHDLNLEHDILPADAAFTYKPWGCHFLCLRRVYQTPIMHCSCWPR